MNIRSPSSRKLVKKASGVSRSPVDLTKVKNENVRLKQLVKALKSENLQLQKKVASMEAKNVSAKNRIKALENLKDPYGDIARGDRLRSLTREQLQNELAELLGPPNTGVATGNRKP